MGYTEFCELWLNYLIGSTWRLYSTLVIMNQLSCLVGATIEIPGPTKLFGNQIRWTHLMSSLDIWRHYLPWLCICRATGWVLCSHAAVIGAEGWATEIPRSYG